MRGIYPTRLFLGKETNKKHLIMILVFHIRRFAFLTFLTTTKKTRKYLFLNSTGNVLRLIPLLGKDRIIIFKTNVAM